MTNIFIFIFFDRNYNDADKIEQFVGNYGVGNSIFSDIMEYTEERPSLCVSVQPFAAHHCGYSKLGDAQGKNICWNVSYYNLPYILFTKDIILISFLNQWVW